MGDVYLAHDPSGSEVALKVLHSQAAAQPTLRKRFLREARATMALVHPNVVRIWGTFEHEDTLVIAMELLRGSTLAEHLADRGKLALSEAADVFCPIVSALGSAHAIGIVHRDMKPENVFLTNAVPRVVKVLDFGIAKLKKGDVTSALTRTGMIVGTPFYMPPEQAFGESDVDHRADVWALGMMLFEALSGQLPTRGASAQEVMRHLLETEFSRLDALDPTIPREIADLVARMIVRERNDRLTDLREVHAALSEHGTHDAPRFDAPLLHAGLARSDLLTFDDAPNSPSAGGTAPLLAAPVPTRKRLEATKLEEVALAPRRTIDATHLDPEVLRQLHSERQAPAPRVLRAPVIPPPSISERRPQRSKEWLWIGIGAGIVILLLLVLLLR